eukprot:m.218716 g.218716  ORF g.218716 m.218716 type:complete len:287 (+) comp10790_c1_seq1:180-1040(+)
MSCSTRGRTGSFRFRHKGKEVTVDDSPSNTLKNLLIKSRSEGVQVAGQLVASLLQNAIQACPFARPSLVKHCPQLIPLNHAPYFERLSEDQVSLLLVALDEMIAARTATQKKRESTTVDVEITDPTPESADQETEPPLPPPHLEREEEMSEIDHFILFGGFKVQNIESSEKLKRKFSICRRSTRRSVARRKSTAHGSRTASVQEPIALACIAEGESFSLPPPKPADSPRGSSSASNEPINLNNGFGRSASSPSETKPRSRTSTNFKRARSSIQSASQNPSLATALQ